MLPRTLGVTEATPLASGNRRRSKRIICQLYGTTFSPYRITEMSTVGANNKRSTDSERSSTIRAHPSGIPTPTYTIRQMLKDVKGIDGKPYIDKNGMPSWGEAIQFYRK